MITKLVLDNFKSWAHADIAMAPLTGLFGTNSSGKTSILQALLLMKQTVESNDRRQALNLGDAQSYVRLGPFSHLVHGQQLPGSIGFEIDWNLPQPLYVPVGETGRSIDGLHFGATISQRGTTEPLNVEHFDYSFDSGKYRFVMRRKGESEENEVYEFIQKGYLMKRNRGNRPMPNLVKFYGFPDQIYASFPDSGFLADFVLQFEDLLGSLYYLGPLREYPLSNYTWSGEQPEDVGDRGQRTVQALLASRQQEKISLGPGRGRRAQTVEERVAEWLKRLGLIYDFSVAVITKDNTQYEVRVKLSPDAPSVLITEVGFGVSQILPVLTLCYYAPWGSTIVLEQPEIHLHPAVQAGLADVFIDAIKLRGVQIIVESHSEHLLRRLQRRVAEESVSRENGGLPAEMAKLYFCKRENGTSELVSLGLNALGDITNWPAGFFGDIAGDVAAKTRADIELIRRGITG